MTFSSYLAITILPGILTRSAKKSDVSATNYHLLTEYINDVLTNMYAMVNGKAHDTYMGIESNR